MNEINDGKKKQEDEEDFKPKLVQKLQDIFNKYNGCFETGDRVEFQNIIDTLQNNLNDD